MAMKGTGFNNADIARELGISRERVSYIFKRWSREQEAIPA